MKVAVWALIVVAVYFVYQFTVGEVFRDYQSCYDDAALEVSAIEATALNVCVQEKIVFQNMNQCIADLQQSSNFASFLYQATPTEDTVEAELQAHNESCPGHTVKAPQSTFYLSATKNR